MEIPFVGGGYSGRSTNLNAQVCQNWYLEIDQQEGKSPKALINTPGMLLWGTSGTASVVRGLYVWSGYLYAVVGNTLYRFDSIHLPTNVGTLGTSTGKVFMAGGTTHLCIVDGTDGYYQTAFPSTTLNTIIDVDFPSAPTSLTYQDGYFIVTKADSDSFFISASEDASSWDGLDFASAEDTPDDALVVVSRNRELWVFGEVTTEVLYNSGDTDFPFSRVSGGVFDYGIGSADSVTEGYEGLFILDNRYKVCEIDGYQRKIISTPQVEFQIQNYTVKNDAIGYSYTQEGHSFYVLTFPSESKTWCFDITTGIWHTRSSGLAGARHRSNCCAYFNGKTLVGDYLNGNIYELDLDTYTDIGATIQRKRTAQVVHNDRKKLFHSQLEIEFEAGVGSVTGRPVLTAVLTGDAVSSVTITDGGSGLSVAPQLIFTGGGGTGAVATATITAGVITLVTVITGGSGYTSAPTITVAGGTSDPQAMLDWSDDGGHVWGNEHWTGIGAIGEYKNRAVWRRLGTSRERIYRLTITDAVKPIVIGAHLEAVAGNA
jgi:hypothetical protein